MKKEKERIIVKYILHLAFVNKSEIQRMFSCRKSSLNSMPCMNCCTLDKVKLLIFYQLYCF